MPNGIYTGNQTLPFHIKVEQAQWHQYIWLKNTLIEQTGSPLWSSVDNTRLVLSRMSTQMVHMMRAMKKKKRNGREEKGEKKN